MNYTSRTTVYITIIARRILLVTLTLFMWSCSATRVDNDDKIGAPFDEHPNAAVRYPAHVGGIIGAIIGVPLTIVALPITVPVAAATDQNATPLVPLLGSYLGFSTVFGAISWPLFGWWKIQDY